MRTSKPMQAIMTKIAGKYRVELSIVGAYLKLEQAGYQPLHLEVIGRNLVAVSHTFIQNGDVMRDPEIVFFTGTGEWTPISVTQDPLGVYREYAEVSEDGREVISRNPRGQADLSFFANQFALNIRAQQWHIYGNAVKIVHGHDDAGDSEGEQVTLAM